MLDYLLDERLIVELLINLSSLSIELFEWFDLLWERFLEIALLSIILYYTRKILTHRQMELALKAIKTQN